MGKGAGRRDRRQAARVARERQMRARAQAAARRRQLGLVGGAVALAVLVVALLIYANRPGQAEEIEARTGEYPTVPQAGRVLGDANAPVTVVEYGDYQCPGCGQFATESEDDLVEDYVATGRVRYEYRDFAFLGDRTLDRTPVPGATPGTDDYRDESTRAAEAAACAADQGRFWDVHATLFASQSGENEGAFEDDRLRAVADAVGLDRAAFDACFDGRVKLGEILAMKEEARAIPVPSTPAFLVNGQLIDYRGYDSLTAAIDAALGGQS